MSLHELKPYQVEALVEELISKEDPLAFYDELECIGSGATADIVKAVDKRTDDVVAIKKFKAKYSSEDDWKEIMKEIRFLKMVKCDNLVCFQGSFLKGAQPWIVMDYCLGSCYDIMDLFKTPFTEEQLKAVTHGVLKALDYLHKNELLHRDVKARNILLSDQAEVKLCDFGVSADLHGRDGKANTFIGSPYWLAPEVILAMETGHYSYPADIWSLGITILELAEMKPPLFELQAMSALFRIPSNPSPKFSDPSAWSSELNDFLALALEKSASARPLAPALLKHLFLSDAETTSRKVLTDLINLSKEAVRGEIDLSLLANNGLVNIANSETSSTSTLQPVVEEEEDDDNDISVSQQSDDSSLPNKNAPASNKNATNPVPSRRTPEANTTTALHEKGSPSKQRTAQGATASTHDEGMVKPEVEESGVIRRASKYNTIRLPSMRQREIHDSRESAMVNSQMRALRKLQKKKAEANKHEKKKQYAEISTLKKRLADRIEELQKGHETEELILSKEHQTAEDKLEKTQAQERKRYEEELHKFTDRRKKDSKTHLSGVLSDLKKAHKRELKDAADKKAAKREFSDKVTELEAKRKSDHKTKSLVYVDSNMKILRSRQKIVAARLHLEQTEEALRMKEKHLEERMEVSAVHNTKSLHALQRQHLQQLQSQEVEYAEERQKLELLHLQENHARSITHVKRHHNTQSKSFDKRLKKLDVGDEEVQEVYRRQTAQHNELQRVKQQHERGLADKKLVKQLEKMEKQALHEARRSVVKIETIKLNEKQLKEFNTLKRRQDEERDELVSFFDARKDHMTKMHNYEMQSLEDTLGLEFQGAQKLKAVELDNFQRAKAQTLASEQEKLERITTENEGIIAAETNKIKSLGPEWQV